MAHGLGPQVWSMDWVRVMVHGPGSWTSVHGPVSVNGGSFKLRNLLFLNNLTRINLLFKIED